MKTRPKKKPLMFGDFIAAAYEACGKSKAGEIVRTAVNARWVVFEGPLRLVIY